MTLYENMWPIPDSVKIHANNNRSVNDYGTIYLVVNIRGSVETIRFKVVDCLATQGILGCYYYDKYID